MFFMSVYSSKLNLIELKWLHGNRCPCPQSPYLRMHWCEYARWYDHFRSKPGGRSQSCSPQARTREKADEHDRAG